MTDIHSFLKSDKIFIFDGAMGTFYSSMHGNAGKKCESANYEEPDTVIDIHRSYIEAGCNAIKTNTFSVSADIAAGNSDEGIRIIRSGCDAAQKAAGDSVFVFADIGTVPEEAGQNPCDIYTFQAKLFLEKGINCFLIETAHSIKGIPEFARWLKKASPDSCLFVCFAVGSDGFTSSGSDGRVLFYEAYGNDDIDAAGFNCTLGPYHMNRLISTLKPGSKRICAMPNAGYPSVIGRRAKYGGSPEYFQNGASELIGAGVTVLGGCCGTTPKHIKYLRRLTDSPESSYTVKESRTAVVSRRKEVNLLREKINGGQRIIAVEYDPPENDNADVYFKGVNLLKEAGADAVTIADCPVGIPHIDSSMLAYRLKNELNIEPIPHIACRDKNLNAIKALLLGLSCGNVHNVLPVTGDPMPSAKRDEVKSVFNCNSRHLINYISSLDSNTLSAPFTVFAALNVNAKNFDVELERAKEKIENGAFGFMTQPVLSAEALENLRKAKAVLNAKIFAGIYPVVSYRNACFMNNEIAGINVSDDICEMYRDKSREEAEDIAVNLSVKIARDAEPFCDGLYIMTPFNRTGLVARIIKEYKSR